MDEEPNTIQATDRNTIMLNPNYIVAPIIFLENLTSDFQRDRENSIKVHIKRPAFAGLFVRLIQIGYLSILAVFRPAAALSNSATLVSNPFLSVVICSGV